MAHTVVKQVYCEEEKKYVECEVLVFDEEEDLPPGVDRREIVLYCKSCGKKFSEISDGYTSNIEGEFPETELIDQYEDFDNRSD
ncbi:MAG: hypothetical protein PHV68_00925 [Candidatus Gastranaerophilales bacterium]|nr:hypothetical protein [Candidatus Gastranaerophilales bacterium]